MKMLAFSSSIFEFLSIKSLADRQEDTLEEIT